MYGHNSWNNGNIEDTYYEKVFADNLGFSHFIFPTSFNAPLYPIRFVMKYPKFIHDADCVMCNAIIESTIDRPDEHGDHVDKVSPFGQSLNPGHFVEVTKVAKIQI
jgi:hypothetical protein